MTGLAATLFKTDFKLDVFVYLGIVYFSLFLLWFFSAWQSLLERLQSSAMERVWMIFGLVAGLGFAGIATAEWGVDFFGTALFLGLCIGLALIDDGAAACLLASSLYLRPWELIPNDPYLGMLPRMSIVLCLAHLFMNFARDRKFNWVKNQLSFILLGFAFWCFASTTFAPHPAQSQSSFFDGFLKSITLYFILIQMVRTGPQLRQLLGSLLVSFLFVGSVSVYQTLRISALTEGGDMRLTGFGAFQNSNDIAALMVFIMPFAAFAALRKTESIFMRFLGGTTTLIAFVTIVLSRSRGALLGIAMMVGAYFIIKIGRKAIVPVAAALVLLALPAMILISNRSDRDLEGSSESRKTYLKAGLRMGVTNPVLGVGFDAYPENLVRYSTEALEEGSQMTAHNSFVLVFAETGFPGLLLFLGAYAFCALLAWKVYRSYPEFLLAVLGYGVAMFFLSHSYLMYPYLLYALVHIAQTIRKDPELETETVVNLQMFPV